MIEFLKFHERASIAGRSYDSNVLIMNFSDKHIITLAYVLETPIEITSLEFHPENPNVLVGGCLNGQVIVWDLSALDYRITTGVKTAIKGDDEGAMGEEDDKQQSIVKMKHLC